MKKPTKKTLKGVPMPDDIFLFRCYWDEVNGQIAPRVRFCGMTLLSGDTEAEIVRQYRLARKWLANPATPKGVRR